MKIRNARIRATAAGAAIAAALTLAGCQTNGTLTSTRHLKPLSPEILAALEKRNMPKESPILVRIFKQEAELELWKQDNTGRYALLKTYPICRWSGELGPKIKEGDRQAPEGFYDITPAQMNPNSQFYLAFNLGYPNAFDKAHGRTGAHLMVHGDCSSRGCYAMTDDQISEIYSLGRESFFGGQRSFQVQAYPFRMTPANFAKHRNNPHMPFWKMLKEGNDHFEVTGLEPKIDVCEKRYVFNAQPPANATPVSSFKFNPAGRCPAYEIDAEIASALGEKKQRDEVQTAEIVRRGMPPAPIRTGADGGMHPTFLAKLKPKEIREADGTIRMVVDAGDAKSLGTQVNPPREPAEQPILVAGAAAPREATGSVAALPAQRNQGAYALAAAESRAAPTTREASAGSGSLFTRMFSSSSAPAPSSEGTLSRMGRFLGLSSDEPRAEAAGAAVVPVPRPAPSRTANAGQPHAPRIVPASETQQASAPAYPQSAAQASASAPERPRQSGSASLLSGAQPVMPAGSFESRWGGLR